MRILIDWGSGQDTDCASDFGSCGACRWSQSSGTPPSTRWRWKGPNFILILRQGTTEEVRIQMSVCNILMLDSQNSPSWSWKRPKLYAGLLESGRGLEA